MTDVTEGEGRECAGSGGFADLAGLSAWPVAEFEVERL